MPQVIANYPNRAQSDVDGYIAVVDCDDMGRRYVLDIPGRVPALVAVADCANVRDMEHIEYTFGGQWLADVDATLWGDLPPYPMEATLWPVPVWRARQAQLQRIK